MAWCKLEDTFCEDPKWDVLAEELDTNRRDAAGMVAFLWSWCVTHSPDGHLPTSTRTIARAAQWDGDNDELIRALLLASVIDKTKNGYEVHGFAKRAESFIRAKRVQKQRSRAVLRHSAVTGNAQSVSPDEIVKRNDPSERRGEEKRRDLMSVSDSDLPPAIKFEDPQRSPPATPAGKHPSVWSELAGEVERAKPLTPAAQIRRAYHESYAEKFNREFKGWGKRENGQAAQLVGSWSLATVLELIPKFFKWNNPQVMMAGYPFGLGHASFISRIHELDADTHAPDRKRLAAAAMANERQVGNEDAEKIRTESNLNSFVDKFAREVTEAEKQVRTSIGTRKPQDAPVKLVSRASEAMS